MRNPYDVLGVARDADQDAIRKAYRELARTYHPDRNKAPEAEKKFKEINAAYDAVGDDEKRKLFDEFGEESLRPGFDAAKARQFREATSRGGFNGFGGGQGFPGGFPGGGGFSGDFDFGDGSNMDDVLGSIFGAQARGPRRGRDIKASMMVDPMLAITGGETQITLPRESGSPETLKVRVPAGVADGGTLKLRGQGHPPPNGGPCGDLLIVCHVPQHPLLKRDGTDLEMEVPLTILEAMKGASVTVPTPTGEVRVTVPPGVQSGQRLRLKGRGVQTSTPGDLYIILRPTPPATQDPALLQAAEALEAAYAGDVRAKLVL